ncbi:four helix bundle protein [Chryseobacterium sp. D764]|jgi:four helix bundle protein|uniref:four helix bundle protein n=1 Tax=unclassified Chryseobacterium TaxID=2593645 RepID=UPI00098550D3|nr:MULTISPECIES: four helix bundle protein [unclassified Chryseobacterium]QXU48548.1 four helix bundle protein [Chryseobacterium sp. D764]CAD0223189.1 Four helix bundle protein [Chryseobacterium sp. JV274]
MNREYTELVIWMEGRKLVNLTYILTANFPKEELLALTGQIRKMVTSVSFNITEGSRRQNPEDTLPFLQIAGKSLYKLETQFHLASDQQYISKEDFKIINKKILLCKKLVSGFINCYKLIENEK